MASASEAKRGEIGKQTFDAVHALVHKGGMKTTEAFKKVAAETGRSVGTVQTSYYRIARQTAGSGVKTRSRKNKAAAKTVSVARGIRRTPATQADQLNELARELEDRAKKLRAIAKSLEGLEKDAAAAREIASLLS